MVGNPPIELISADGLAVFASIPRVSKIREAAPKQLLPEPYDNVLFYSHSIVKNYLQFVPVCRSLLQFVLFTPSLKKCRESMGSNLGHGFSGHLNHFLGSHGVMKNPHLLARVC